MMTNTCSRSPIHLTSLFEFLLNSESMLVQLVQIAKLTKVVSFTHLAQFAFFF